MKQAITTRFFGPTNTRGSRVRASCQRGSVTVDWDFDVSHDENHIAAKDVLVDGFASEDEKKYGTGRDKNPWLRPTAHGVLEDGRHVFVFI